MRSKTLRTAAVSLLAAACGRDGGAGSGGNEDCFTIGYGGLSSEFPFVADVNRRLEAAAEEAGLDLIILDTKFDPQVALSNADTLVLRQADLIIEFQTDAQIAPALCEKFDAAGWATR